MPPRVAFAPWLAVRVLDAHVAGAGSLEARLLGAPRLARATGPGLDRGEAMCHLAELARAPRAILHNPHPRWRRLDPATVEASVPSAGGPARVRLVFEGGDLARVEADDRPRAVDRRVVPTPWRGCFGAYREIGGVRVPTRAEVSWAPSTGPFACWRGEITGYEAR